MLEKSNGACILDCDHRCNFNLTVIGKYLGATPLSIIIGHNLDTVTHVVGDFGSVSATGVTQYPTTTLFDAATNQPTGEVVQSTLGPDHLTITGILASGALATITWRSGVKGLTNGRTKLLWEIDGEEGSISMRSSATSQDLSAAFLNTREPDELWVNGEKIEVEGSEEGLFGFLTRGWTSFAKKEEGRYPTIEDAVKLKRLLEAVETSAETGRTITL